MPMFVVISRLPAKADDVIGASGFVVEGLFVGQMKLLDEVGDGRITGVAVAANGAVLKMSGILSGCGNKAGHHRTLDEGMLADLLKLRPADLFELANQLVGGLHLPIPVVWPKPFRFRDLTPDENEDR